jgi:NADH-quinone oxidoreductase subunit E
MSVRRLADVSEQPPSFAFSRVNREWAQQTIQKYPKGRQQSAVIPLMMRAQEQEGWLTKPAIETIADMLDMPYIRALEVATFYTQFQLKPVGRRAHVQVCGTTPCMLRGAQAIFDVCKRRIHHDPMHVSADGNFSWEEVECLGACVNAPVAQINFDYYEDLSPESFTTLLADLVGGKPVKPGPQVDRQLSAPMGGATTLTDPSLYARRSAGQGLQPALRDADAKTPGEAANLREAPAPKPPAADSSASGKS